MSQAQSNCNTTIRMYTRTLNQCHFCKGKAGSPHTAEPRFFLKANKTHPLSQGWDSSFPCSPWPLARAGPRGAVGVASWRQTLSKAQRDHRRACGQVCPPKAIPGSFPLWKQFLTHVLPTPNALLPTSFMKLLRGSIYQTCPVFSFSTPAQDPEFSVHLTYAF